MKDNILLVSTDNRLKGKIEEIISQQGINMHCAATIQELFSALARFHYLVIVMDTSFSDFCNTRLIERIRELDTTQILVVSANPSERDEIQNLNAGADQYISLQSWKNIELRRANLHAMIRRASFLREQDCQSKPVLENGLKLNSHLRKAYLQGNDLHLTPKQFALLHCLVMHIGEVVPKEDLYQAAWKHEYDINSDGALKYHIKELRKKLETYGASDLIQTSWGLGYQFSLDIKSSEDSKDSI